MLNNGTIRLLFKVMVIHKRYECYVSMQATLQECLELLNDLIEKELEGAYTLDDNAIVLEEFLQQPCSKHVPLTNLGVYDGCSFLIY